MEKYIYLDWNVIKYIKKPRENNLENDILFKEIVNSLSKKYRFPFCEAHLKDLTNGYNEETKKYVDDDLKFLNQLSNKKAIGINDKGGFTIVEHDSEILFKEIISEKNKELDLTNINDPNGTFKVDMDKMDKDNPLYEKLKENDGVYSPGLMKSFHKELYDKIFTEIDPYKDFRKYIPNVIEAIDKNETLTMNKHQEKIYENIKPFINTIKNNNIETFEENFLEIFREFMLATRHDVDKMELGEKITLAYSLLDFHPYFKEKITKKNKLSNMVRDSKHIYYAHKAKYYVTEDESTQEKTQFIYRVFNIDTVVIGINEFITKFS